MPYDIFICYSRKDKKAVQSIIHCLDEQKVSYWIDLEGIYSGEEFASVIHDNMIQSDAVLFVSSKNSNQSKWVSGEIAMAFSFKKKVIPLRLDNAPYNGSIQLYLAALDAINYYEDEVVAMDNLIKSVRHSFSTNTGKMPARKSSMKGGYATTWLLSSILLVVSALFVLLIFRKDDSSIETMSVNKASISFADIDTVLTQQKESDLVSLPESQEKGMQEPKASKQKVKEKSNIQQSQNNGVEQLFEFENDILRLNLEGISYNLKLVSGGDFMMGATGKQKEFAKEDEKNVRRIYLDSFYIGETEVTVNMWNKVMGQNVDQVSDSQKPKTNVTYNDCCLFCEALSSRLNLNISLPTEAEWEYSAKVNTKEEDYIYAGGPDIDDFCWYALNTDYLCEIAKKRPNASGLYDMSGNAAEWCIDWYGKSYTNTQSTNPQGPYSGSERVVRGGSCVSMASECRITARDHLSPEKSTGYIGFRIVCHTK